MRQVIVSAGDAITAKLVEQAGFDGIWVSGFEASARLGLPDNGSITMTEMLNVTRPIVDAVKIPVWVDVDTGYGNFARTVKEFERIGAAGICVEDNVPQLKVNSLWGDKIELMAMEDFSKKIKVKRNRLKIIARTEALIRGYGMKEAGVRLAYYRNHGGADILMPHTRKEIFTWNQVDPLAADLMQNSSLAIVPTKFPDVKNKELFDLGYEYVIWANQTERVKIKATREALEFIKNDDSAGYVHSMLSATLDEMKGLTPDE